MPSTNPIIFWYAVRHPWTALKWWLERKSSVYPAKWYWPIVRIYGGPEGSESRKCYMTRVMLGPATPWGQLYLHVFHREDIDRDPHDHPFTFWTMPLNCSYYEEVYEHAPISEHVGNGHDGCFKIVRVPRFWISKRLATHTHRIVSTDRRTTFRAPGHWPLVTLVWRGPNERKWGFWCHASTVTRERFWLYYRQYLDKGATEGPSANVQGIDAACPGQSLNLYYHTKDRNPV